MCTQSVLGVGGDACVNVGEGTSHWVRMQRLNREWLIRAIIQACTLTFTCMYLYLGCRA